MQDWYNLLALFLELLSKMGLVMLTNQGLRSVDINLNSLAFTMRMFLCRRVDRRQSV